MNNCKATEEKLSRSLLEKEQKRKEEVERNIMLVGIEAERRKREKIQVDDDLMVSDLAFIVRRLVYEVRKRDGDSDLAAMSMDYLSRKGLKESPIGGKQGADLRRRGKVPVDFSLIEQRDNKL